MSHFDARVDPLAKHENAPPVPAPQEHAHPARRLLAHDLEHLQWDDDGEGAVPPPD